MVAQTRCSQRARRSVEAAGQRGSARFCSSKSVLLLILAVLAFGWTRPVRAGSLRSSSSALEATISVYAGTTTRISNAYDGGRANGGSYEPAISADGQVVAFVSKANNLVGGDTCTGVEIFVHDRTSSQTARASTAPGGLDGNGDSFGAAISADGQYVAFYSYAKNLLGPGMDTNEKRDVFVQERATGRLFRASVSNGKGEQAVGGHSESPRISADGRHVAFRSAAKNLVPNDPSVADAFVHDWTITETIRVSVGVGGTQPDGESHEVSISGDGRLIAFASFATNLVPGDTNGKLDVFVYDRVTRETRRVSVSSEGVQGDHDSNEPSISLDGRWVAFTSQARNLVPDDGKYRSDVFVHDLHTGTTRRVSVRSDGGEADAPSSRSSISADGRYVVFQSEATNLVSGDTNDSQDIFLHDVWTGETTRVSVRSDGTGRSGSSEWPSVSADGCIIAFQSFAQLVAQDTDGQPDIYIREWDCPRERVYIPFVLATAGG